MTDRMRAGALVLALSALAALALWGQPATLERWQERVFDALIVALPAPAPEGPPVLVVDIGATDEAGVPWDRAASARLAAALADAGPAVVAWDIVFAGNCAEEPRNAALASALSQAPAVLGFLLSGSTSPPPSPAPALAVTGPVSTALWSAPGAEMPCPAFAASAAGIASVSLPGDDTARVRMVPAAVAVAGTAWPALPIEALRIAQGHPTPLADGAVLHLGDRRFPLGPSATLRFRPSPEEARAARTLGAGDVLVGQGLDRLAGAVVFVGSSLPARGGLRPTAADPLYPSIQIAADLATGLSSGILPWRPAAGPMTEAAAMMFGGIAVALLVALLSPMRALLGALMLAAIWAGSAGLAHALTGRLLDPALPPLALAGATASGLILQAATLFRRERALRLRMGQLLPAAVVARLAEDPRLLRLAGERRQVTALFTDLEGFSTLTNSLPPETLITTLDAYFAAVSDVVLRHGGMIDKIVGDAVHALFNAPLDQPGHVDAALSAAAEIIVQTEALRATLPIGRTRIGIETGPAILGDVGSGARIDYTAHGPAVNLAARLQEAGKSLGPALIIGPAAAKQTNRPLRQLGLVEVRSFGPLALFTLG